MLKNILIFSFIVSLLSSCSKFVQSYQVDSLYNGQIDDFYRPNGTVDPSSTKFTALLRSAAGYEIIAYKGSATFLGETGIITPAEYRGEPERFAKFRPVWAIPGEQGGERVANTGTQKAARNELISRCLLASERIGGTHISKIPATQAGSNTVLGTGANLLSGLATAVNPASTKTALAAGSSLFGATRELVNNEVFYNFLGPAIISKIEEIRKQKRANIQANLSKDISQYSVFQGLVDVADFHESASFYTGIREVAKAASRVESTSDKLLKLQALKLAGLSDAKYEEALQALIDTPESLPQ